MNALFGGARLAASGRSQHRLEQRKPPHISLFSALFPLTDALLLSELVCHLALISWIASEITKLTQNLQSKTLEHLSVALCNWLLASCDSTVKKVKVQIDKPAAISQAESATVVAKRKRIKKTEAFEPSPSTAPLIPHASSSSHSSNFNHIVSPPKTIFDIAGIDFVGKPQLPLSTKSTKPEKRVEELYYIAIGSNLGERAHHIHDAIQEVRKIANVRLVSFLYETPAAYVTDQPSFLNCTISVDSYLDPRTMLQQLKRIEAELGREKTFRYGPRVIDLDIIFNGSTVTNEADLVIPHASMHERAFVMVPLLDIIPHHFLHPVLRKPLHDLFDLLPSQDVLNTRRVIPIPASSSSRQEEKQLYVAGHASSYLMGIINATPDSFSDGNQNLAPNDAHRTIQAMLQSDPNVIIDVGGQSTAPGRPIVPAAEELSRIEPILNICTTITLPDTMQVQPPPTSLRPIVSVDTTKLEVARKAFTLGADILNDVYAVSRFYLDRTMQEEFAELVRASRKPWIMMHCRGTSETMKLLVNYDEGRVVDQLVQETIPAIKCALELGVMPWQIIIDPGIGFAKSLPQNAEILRDLSRFKLQLGHFPLLVGASRKRFLGTITNTENEPAETRDTAGLALIGPIIASGANFIRVHDVKPSLQVKQVYEAIWQPQMSDRRTSTCTK